MAQRKNPDNSDVGGTVRPKYQHHCFCQGACAYVGLIWEVVSLAGFHSSSEGMWLTELSHDSDFLPSIVGCPRGWSEYAWAQGCFPFCPTGSSQMVLLVVERVITIGLKNVAQGAGLCPGWQGLPIEQSCLTEFRTIIACRYTGVCQTWVNLVHIEGLWKTLLINPVSALRVSEFPLSCYGKSFSLWKRKCPCVLELKIGWGKRGSVSLISLCLFQNCIEKIFLGYTFFFFVVKRICFTTVNSFSLLGGAFWKGAALRTPG